MTPDELQEAIDNAPDLPPGVVAGIAVYPDTAVGSNGEPQAVTVFAVAFQVEQGGAFLRQQFVLENYLAEMVADAITNPVPLPSEGEDI